MRSILVCYEEGPTSARVVERAAELAKALDARVLVTGVAPVMGLAARGVGSYDPLDSPDRHERELEDAVERLAQLGLADVERVVGLGDPARAIVDLAEERSVDLIVLGAHDGGPLSRVLGGSVSDDVARRATTDVLVVR